jgi:phosphonate transport system substrate-binding protein
MTMLVPALLAAGCTSDDTTSDGPPPEWPASIVLGVVPGPDQTGLSISLRPMIESLESRLGLDVALVEAPDPAALVADIRAERVDFGAVEPFTYASAGDADDDIVAVSQLARFGSFTRHGEWFTNDDTVCAEPPVDGTALTNAPAGLVQVSALESDAQQVGVVFDADGATFGATTSTGSKISPGRSCIGDLEAVRGSTVAFITEGSLAGGVFPSLQLARLGIETRTAIDVIYTDSHDGSVRAVYDGDVRFGVAFDDARRRIADEHPDVGERVIVFNLTDEIPHEALVARRDLPDLLAASVQDALAAYLETGAGATLVERTLGWTDIRTAVESDFDVVREATAVVGPAEAEVTTRESPGSP